MASRRRTDDPTRPRRSPASSPDALERKTINAAYALAAQQIEEGVASSQVITHFLKMGSSREHLEQQRIEMETELLQIKKEAIASAARVEELMVEALDAFKSYSPDGSMPQSRRDFDD